MENAGLSLELVNSWNLNPLELDKARNHAAAMYFVGPHNHGISFDPILMGNFLQTAELGYVKSCSYHNWFHAIDVTHGVYRLLHTCATDAFLSCNERYALLVSAVCHDVGHPGLNNTFLIETSHDLALRYNDKSPLENMHCAKLFEIVAQVKCNIFATLAKAQYQDVRKVCIDAILNTDNAQHFTMIKEVQMMYEMNSEILEASRELYADDPDNFPPREAMECFREPESRKLLAKVLLHVADISNSMKPFRICRLWAWQVLEEFFLQGDEEKRLGVPVQALNDREKVNRPFSQVGFIEFLVSPLIFAVIKVLPPMEGLADQMVQNVRTWHSNWANETKPPPSDAEQSALAERVHKLEARYLESR
uniref:PDEase domain-containing protein n=1 Tax=Alexandrium catenella TaxID=2925 RepID=A0A7S1RV87_ALECA